MLKQTLALSAEHEISRRLLHEVTAYSEETGTHLKRVASMSVRLARAAGLTGDALEEVRYGALLHDIGKKLIPVAILHKPGRLDPAELMTMRTHSQLGADLAERAGFRSGVVSIIKYHHERFDGDGYPDGLQGEAIPFGARILAVVDTVDTIMHERAYDPARSYEVAQSELARCAGTQFDPHLAAMFSQMLDGIADKKGWKGEAAA